MGDGGQAMGGGGPARGAPRPDPAGTLPPAPSRPVDEALRATAVDAMHLLDTGPAADPFVARVLVAARAAEADDRAAMAAWTRARAHRRAARARQLRWTVGGLGAGGLLALATSALESWRVVASGAAAAAAAGAGATLPADLAGGAWPAWGAWSWVAATLALVLARAWPVGED